MEISYTGIDAHGSGRAGRQEIKEPAAFVESKFLIGWHQLAVFVEGPAGGHAQVGGIRIRPDGRRVWWAEQTG